MKWWLCASLVMILGLQYELWSSNGGILNTLALKKAISQQSAFNQSLAGQNAQLAVKIDGLRQNPSVIISHAREDLGLVKPGETYYQIVHP